MQDTDSVERLQQAFDSLSSRSALDNADRAETQRALASIENLLYHISFNKDTRRPDVSLISFPDAKSNELFAWFTRTQDSFQHNITTHLLEFLSHIAIHTQLSTNHDASDDKREIAALTRSSLQILQGCLLLHAPSRSLFSRRGTVTILTQYLDKSSIVFDETLTIEVIQTIVSALVDSPINMRTFEAADGLRLISLLFKDVDTEHAVKVKILEFLYFYLIPEAIEEESELEGTQKTTLFHESSTVKGHTREPATDANGLATKKTTTRTSEEKQHLLSRYFHNIDALVRDLHEFKPFT